MSATPPDMLTSVGDYPLRQADGQDVIMAISWSICTGKTT